MEYTIVSVIVPAIQFILGLSLYLYVFIKLPQIVRIFHMTRYINEHGIAVLRALMFGAVLSMVIVVITSVVGTGILQLLYATGLLFN
ncbi:hypothetical protein JNJ66_02970 [Candidatus Saccharibacteria bacterium]|nr:hypothetical protein [Candidatus Saccharibacteria bacterium]